MNKTITASKKVLGFWDSFFRAYGFALIVASFAVVPGLNFMYSLHGGPFWLLLPFGLPYALVRIAIWWFKAAGSDRQFYGRFVFGSVVVYLMLALLISTLATFSIEHTFGLSVGIWTFFAVMTVPFSLPFLFVT